MRLLLVKTSSMGDVIHTLPAVTDALAARGDLSIDWLVEKPFAPLAALHPGVGEAIPVELRQWRRAPATRATRDGVIALRRRLKAGRYDLVIDAQGLLKSAVLARIAGAPVAGYDRASAREGWASLAYHRRYRVPRDLHAVERTRRLLALALGYPPPTDDPDFGLDPGEAPKDADQTAFLIHGTSWETKKWPLADWCVLAGHLADRGMRPVTAYGDEAERRVAEAIAVAVPQTKVLPKTDLRTLADEIGTARLVIGVDTGLTHLASALGRPTVAIFLASRPGLTGPVGRHAVAIGAAEADPDALSPVSRRDQTMATVSVEDVLAAADRLLAADRPRLNAIPGGRSRSRAPRRGR